MAINFDKLPTERPESIGLPEPGFHKATISKATATVSKSGNEYLAVQLKLDTGQMVFDNVMNLDSPIHQYKLSRFVQACGMPLAGELTFTDLGKLALNKEVVVDIKITTDTYNGKERDKAEVNMFDNDIYYPISAYASLVGEEPQPDNDTTTGVY
jgi:hypothetical protein